MTDEDLVARFPGEQLTRDNAAHYRGRLGRSLLVNRCGDCGAWHQPPRPICPECWSGNVAATPVAGRGTIALAMFLHQGPPAEGVDYSTPYPVVVVELPEQEGLRITGTVAGSANEEVVIGAPVEVGWVERAGTPVLAWRLSPAASRQGGGA